MSIAANCSMYVLDILNGGFEFDRTKRKTW
jgi:hypothetical protein